MGCGCGGGGGRARPMPRPVGEYDPRINIPRINVDGRGQRLDAPPTRADRSFGNRGPSRSLVAASTSQGSIASESVDMESSDSSPDSPNYVTPGPSATQSAPATAPGLSRIYLFTFR